MGRLGSRQASRAPRLITDRSAFILANTRVSRPVHCPEIQLHLADDAVALWQLTEEELGRLGLDPPFWAFAWAGGQALARYLLDRPHIVRAKRVLDLASGSGLAAIAAMLAGAASALANDIDPFAAEAARLNADLNTVQVAVHCGDLIGQDLDPDLILVGDLFYDRDLAQRVLAWLRWHQARGVEVFVGDPRRAYFPADAFEELAHYSVPTSRSLEDAEIKQTGVWRLKA